MRRNTILRAENMARNSRRVKAPTGSTTKIIWCLCVEFGFVRTYHQVSMILRLTTADENVCRADSPVVGNVLGRAEVPPLQMASVFFSRCHSRRQEPVGAPPVGALVPLPFTSWHPTEQRECGIFMRDTKTQTTTENLAKRARTFSDS